MYPPDENKFLDTEFIPNSTIVIREFIRKKKWNEKVEKDTILLASFARIKKNRNIDRYEKW